MKNILESAVKIVSKICLRIILIVLLVFVISMIAKFNKNVLAFAEIVECWNASTEKNKVAENYDKLEGRIQPDENFITVSLETANDYPEGWLNSFNEKIIELQKVFPNDMYWNHMNGEPTNPGETNNVYSVTDVPCNHYLNGEFYCNAYYGKSDEVYPYPSTSVQCRGFASLLSDTIFGEDAPVYVFEDYNKLRIGDQARIDGDYHSVFIIDKTDEYVIVAECNEDLESCKISWGRKILKEDLVRLVCDSLGLSGIKMFI